MPLKSKAVATIAIIEGVVLLLLLLGWYLNKTFSGQGLLFGCGGKVYSSATAPNKQLTAYAFERDCGATTGFATFVIIRSAQDKLDLSADLVDGEIVLGTNGDYHPKVKWLSNDKLAIVFDSSPPESSEIWQQNIVHNNIRVVYQGLKP